MFILFTDLVFRLVFMTVLRSFMIVHFTVYILCNGVQSTACENKKRTRRIPTKFFLYLSLVSKVDDARFRYFIYRRPTLYPVEIAVDFLKSL